MRNVLLALIAIPLLACTATVRPGPGGPPPPPPREVRREPPPPPPPDRHRDHDHDRDRDRDRDRGPRIIEGVVRDAITHQPIDRAAVDITRPGVQGEMTVQTGPDGRFRTGEIPRGEFGVRVRREGYVPMNRHARMEDGIARVDFELVPERR